MKFHIVSAVYNFEKWIGKNIEMLKKQTYSDFNCLLIDDCSTDSSVDAIKELISGDKRFSLRVNESRQYKAKNVYEGIHQLNANVDDIIVMIDGDDWLADENVLSYLYDYYSNYDCWMTYGSYKLSSGNDKIFGKPYKSYVIKNNSYRKSRWLACHLKTFRYGLFNKIRKDAFHISESEYRDELRKAALSFRFKRWKYWGKIAVSDLLEPQGEFIRRVDDKAFTIPMLEMAGHRAHFIEKVLYIYNVDNERFSKSIYGNHHKKWPGRLIRTILRSKTPYPRISTLKGSDDIS